MKNPKKYGSWACVIGAAEGLGAAFSRELAKKGFNLLLVDIKEEVLKSTCDELLKTHSIQIKPLIADLNLPESYNVIIHQIQECSCRFLVYNAAYGPVRSFLQNTHAEMDLYINVNVRTMSHLVQDFIRINETQPTGLLLLSSLAGFTGTGLVVPYAATKSYIWNFAEGLYYEFKGSHVDISVCCPGMTDTPNLRSTNPKNTFLSPRPMPANSVAKEAIDRFGKKLFIIPGTGNKISHLLLSKMLPRKWASYLHNYVMHKIYK